MTRVLPLTDRRPARLRLGALAMALVLAGCATQTPFTPPAASVPAQWEQNNASATAQVSNDQWWLQFADPALNQLMDQVLVRNNDLAAAALRVRQAQLQARMSATALAPTVSGSLGSNASTRL